MEKPVCMSCEFRKHYGFNRQSLQYYCKAASTPGVSPGDVNGIAWIDSHWKGGMKKGKLITDCKTHPLWCPRTKDNKILARYKKFYNDDGSPKFIHVWERRSEDTLEKYTVIYTRTSQAGFDKHLVVGRGMSEDPFHGIGVWLEYPRWEISQSHGTRIKFSDLPAACQELVKSDYDHMWKLT